MSKHNNDNDTSIQDMVGGDKVRQRNGSLQYRDGHNPYYKAITVIYGIFFFIKGSIRAFLYGPNCLIGNKGHNTTLNELQKECPVVSLNQWPMF